MESRSIGKEITRFNWCDRRFYSYMEKVLMRLPQKVAFREILDDPEFQIISFEKSLLGCQISFENSIKNLVVLNELLLSEPEFKIIYGLAHEIAHKIAGKGNTGLYEKEAEELMVRWGFVKESEKVDYHQPVCESAGYNTGYEWAKKQKDLSKFEEFYHEWDEGRLSSERLDLLLYTADIMLIFDEMGGLENSNSNQEIAKGEKIYPGDDSLDRGVIHGIMGFLKEKKNRWRSSFSQSSEGPKEALFLETLERAYQACDRLYDDAIRDVTLDYLEKYPEVKRFSDSLTEIGELLEQLKEIKKL